MTTTMPTAADDASCPECGSTFTIDPGAETERTILRQSPGTMPYVETVRVPVAVAFCNGCEFCVELRGTT